MSALEGLVVVDLSRGVAGPLAAQFLADYGADVIRVEGPNEDLDRARPGFHWFNRGKSGVVLDPASNTDRTKLAALLDRADVCVVVNAASELAAWGTDTDTVERRNPRLVLLETPLWVGEPDPLTEIDSVELLAARVGLAWNQSSFAGGPIELIEPQVLYVQGAWGACATVAALTEREASGLGQRVCVSGVHAFVVFGPHLLVFDPSQPLGRRDVGPGGPNPTYSRYRCADGRWLFVGALGPKFQRRVLALLGIDDIWDDPRIAQDPDRLFMPDNYEWVRDRIAASFERRTRADWLRDLEHADVPSSPLLDRAAWFDHEQVRAMGLHAQVQHRRLGIVAQVGDPIRLSETPSRTASAAPEPGEHQDRLDGLLARGVAPVAGVPAGGPSPEGPLRGTRVLSLGAYVAGPYSARLLGELGAEVIKVEPPEGDPWRIHGFYLNIGMLGLALDITTQSGRDAFLQLVRTADVVLDNFRPGVLERLGIDDASLRAVNPSVITASVTGFGPIGPMSQRPGFDPVLGAISGMQTAQGGAEEPVMLSLAVNDTATAALTALGVTLALFDRHRTGVGQRVETSLAATSLFLQGEELVMFDGRPPAPIGGRDFRGFDAWHHYYRCADGWVRADGDAVGVDDFIAAGFAIDREGWSVDPAAALAAALVDLEVSDARRRLARAGLRSVRVHNAQDLVRDPALMKIDIAFRHENPDGYTYFVPGRLARFSRTMREGSSVPPGVGEHSCEVLIRAGLTATQVDELIDSKVVAQGMPVYPRVLTAYR